MYSEIIRKKYFTYENKQNPSMKIMAQDFHPRRDQKKVIEDLLHENVYIKYVLNTVKI